MYFVKEKDFEALKAALELLPQGTQRSNYSRKAQSVMMEADNTIIRLIKNKHQQNAKTAKYIADKRKTNKNYARKLK